MAELRRPIRNITASRLWQLATVIPALLAGVPLAHAHISVEMGGTHKSRSSDSSLKDAPCGLAGSTRGTDVYMYKPGATINISIVETIVHPGYFRISFDDDGEDGFAIPSGTSGEMGDCAGDPACGPGKEDFCSNDTVLIDNMEPHGGEFGEPAKTYTFSVTLPNVECDNCTLQIIQMMNDFNFHPSAFPEDDIYYQCIDLVLSNSAPDVADAPAMSKGMVCGGGATEMPSTPDGSAGAPAAGSGAAGSGEAGAAGGGAAGSPSTGTGAPMSSGAAGAAPSTPTTPSSGTPSSGAAGRASTAPATAGSPASGTSTMSQAAAGGAAMAPAVAAPTASEDSGGCNASGTQSTSWFGPLAFAMLALGFRRRSWLQGVVRHRVSPR